jgi:hypothetical protein
MNMSENYIEMSYEINGKLRSNYKKYNYFLDFQHLVIKK